MAYEKITPPTAGEKIPIESRNGEENQAAVPEVSRLSHALRDETGADPEAASPGLNEEESQLADRSHDGSYRSRKRAQIPATMASKLSSQPCEA